MSAEIVGIMGDEYFKSLDTIVFVVGMAILRCLATDEALHIAARFGNRVQTKSNKFVMK